MNQNFELSELGVSVRVVGTADQPLFVASDLAKALGYRDSSDMLRSLDSDEIAVPQNLRVRSEDGTVQERKTNLINEMGMWRAIHMSRRPEAKQVRNWINGEVMPAIRKTGSYSVAGKPKFDLNNPDHLRFALLEYTNKVIELSAANRLIAEQRDHAIETKAHISDKKTATAMATASAAVRENTALKKALSSGASFSGKQYSEVVSAIKYMLSAKGESEPSVLARYGAWEDSLWLCAPSTVMAIHRDLINSILAEREPF